jgi:predicted DNA-binding transcriptional regulator YafY
MKGLRFGHTTWHRQDQWLLIAYDLDKEAIRDFAMKDIKEWRF